MRSAVTKSGGRGAALIAALPLLAACAAPPGADVSVRHFASTETAGNGARWHLFVFDPEEARSLDDRIAIARRSIGRERGCDWVGASRAEIEAQTAKQGQTYSRTLLAAPVRCSA
ncbi:hypothetical protein RM543_03450 [Roseicyclus sp. F158]|uniref:Lipoprotein n=1 Tax=Tropicimonas omnivorans TaxID=3075590 RepID=A0ABU3DDD5_9RHOB|nr:hypothetical protein [Roseicyclus sp. F158]MDT0681729.1 hypothetical protein [Roseicyclus sp. F158]